MPWQAGNKLVADGLVRTEQELLDAVAIGGDVRVDGTDVITLTQQINITKPTRIIGGRFSRSSGVAFYITSSDVEVTGVEIVGQGTASGGDTTQKFIYAVGTSAAKLSDINVNNCRLVGSRYDNVWLEWCVDSIVHSNTIKSFLYSGIMLISVDGVNVENNVIADSPLTGTIVNNYGIAITDLDNTVAARSKNVNVTGNRIHLIDWEGIDTHGGDALNITGNTITACPRGIALVVGNSTRVTAATNCVVSANAVHGAGARLTLRTAIWLAGIANTPSDGVVTGNVITGAYPDNFFTDYIDRGKTYIGQNSVPLVPWTPITLNGWTAHSTIPPEYMVDGNTVTLRGGITYSSSTTTIGSLSSTHARPSQLSFVCYLKGSTSDAGEGMVGVSSGGLVDMFYAAGSYSGRTFFLHGSYQAV